MGDDAASQGGALSSVHRGGRAPATLRHRRAEDQAPATAAEPAPDLPGEGQVRRWYPTHHVFAFIYYILFIIYYSNLNEKHYYYHNLNELENINIFFIYRGPADCGVLW
jgi:hypothetical protein